MINIKTDEEIKTMSEGGRRLSEIKEELRKDVKVGVSALEIEEKAVNLIEKSGGKASFKMVPRYSWATCVNVNEGVVHGIPKKDTIFREGDVVSVDVGLFYKGFHTDTSFSVGLDVDKDTEIFLRAGLRALNTGIKQARAGNYVSDISQALQDGIESNGYSPIKSLVGHGIGRKLHEDPQIPCFVPNANYSGPELVPGLVIAIEIMYAQGSHEVEKGPDSWTIVTLDGTISGLYEETVAITKDGPLVLTRTKQ